jgi:hypothetical protein
VVEVDVHEQQVEYPCLRAEIVYVGLSWPKFPSVSRIGSLRHIQLDIG